MLRQQVLVALAAAASITVIASAGAVGSADVGARTIDPWCVVLGVHLCGALAPRAIELFATCKELDAIILVPCCLDPRTDGELKASARADGRDPYEAKIEQLVGLLRRVDDGGASSDEVENTVEPASARVDVGVLRDMAMRTNKGGARSEGATTCKNAVISALRRPRPASE